MVIQQDVLVHAAGLDSYVALICARPPYPPNP
jgi:hypothetical protein